MRKIVILVIVCALWMLQGCATKNVSRDVVLDTDNGILLLRVHNDRPVKFYVDHADDRVITQAALLDVEEVGPHLKMISLKEGDYELRRIAQRGLMGSVDDSVKPVFTIDAGRINYIGDAAFIFTKSDYVRGSSPGRSLFRLFVVDLEDETLPLAKEAYPDLFDRYLYQRSLAQHAFTKPISPGMRVWIHSLNPRQLIEEWKSNRTMGTGDVVRTTITIPKADQLAARGLELGMTADDVLSALGEPVRRELATNAVYNAQTRETGHVQRQQWWYDQGTGMNIIVIFDAETNAMVGAEFRTRDVIKPGEPGYDRDPIEELFAVPQE